MASIPELVRKKLSEILQSRQDVLLLACRQRAKFEGWLKFELAAALVGIPGLSNLAVEEGYSSSGRSDISFVYENERWFLEFKTANTNWRAEGVENRQRPVTKNMQGIIDDIWVLKEKCAPARGLVVFIIFPVPVSIWNQEQEKLVQHLNRIEHATSIPSGHLIGLADYLPLTDHFGLCIFVDEITP